MGAKSQTAVRDSSGLPPEFPQLCRYLAELSPQPMVAMEGLTHIVRYANPAFRRLLRKEEQHLIGRCFFEAVPEGIANGCAALLDRVYKSGLSEKLTEQEHRTSPGALGELDGAKRFPTHFSYLAWAILHPADDLRTGVHEKTAGVMLQVTDATGAVEFRETLAATNGMLLVSGVRQHELMEALQHSEAQEREARREADIANQSKDLFMAMLSHELRTPLNAIIGWTTILEEDGCDKAEWDEGLEVIQRSARIQLHLIEDMLDVSRIVSGKLELDIGPCRLADIITAARDSVYPAATAKQIELVTEVKPEAGLGFYDEARMQQVVVNLLNNAVKFTPAHGRVTVRLVQDEETAKIEVTDNGAGMSADFIPHIFDRFRQADSTSRRRTGGLGLGLSIVKQIVEMHGGTVDAHSAGEGAGSTFTVTMPVRGSNFYENLFDKRDPETPVPHGRDTTGVPAEASSGQRLDGLRIVAVEDEPDARRLIVKIIEDAGATVAAAGGAAEAVELLKQGNTDLLISDLGMPDEDGYDLIRKVRAAGYSAEQLPAIAVTAFAGKEDEANALQAGYQAHIIKPVDAPRLIRVIAGLAGITG